MSTMKIDSNFMFKNLYLLTFSANKRNNKIILNIRHFIINIQYIEMLYKPKEKINITK